VTSPGRLTDRPTVAAVAGAVTIAFSAILVRLSHASPSTAAVFRCAYALPLLGLLAWVERRRYGPRTRRDLMLSVVAGAFFAADLICWHHAIEDVGAGLATVLGNLQVVLVGVLAWVFLSERAETRVLSAIPVVLAGVVLISGAIGSGAYGRDPARGVVFGIFTGLTYAGFILTLRQGNNDLRRPAGPLFEATLASTVFAAVAGLAIGDASFAPTWPGHGWLALLAISSQVMGWLLISISLPRLPAALTSVLLTIQPVGSVLLGVAIFSESPSGPQLAGVVVVLAGVMLASLGSRKKAVVAYKAQTQEG
jgi:drug/metabolite transporter (DMT)-like permease